MKATQFLRIISSFYNRGLFVFFWAVLQIVQHILLLWTICKIDFFWHFSKRNVDFFYIFPKEMFLHACTSRCIFMLSQGVPNFFRSDHISTFFGTPCDSCSLYCTVFVCTVHSARICVILLVATETTWMIWILLEGQGMVLSLIRDDHGQDHGHGHRHWSL